MQAHGSDKLMAWVHSLSNELKLIKTGMGIDSTKDYTEVLSTEVQNEISFYIAFQQLHMVSQTKEKRVLCHILVVSCTEMRSREISMKANSIPQELV